MLVEICVSNITALNLAAKHRADRVELCQELSCGGLTPSISLVQRSVSLDLNTQVLIRPRSGDFVYDEDEKIQIMEDVVHYQKLGIQGIVVGALNEQRSLDISFLKRLRMLTPNIELTFHKAFDDIDNWQKAIEQLISMKYDRILTSGCEVNVFKGKERLKEIIEFASGRIQILPGGGISPENIGDIIEFLKPSALHFSGAKKQRREKSIYFNSEILLVDEEKLKLLIDYTRS
tara:strand:- start:54 stop:752 length:699 start_codon:yes stop_codon:yes gene_type:complete